MKIWALKYYNERNADTYFHYYRLCEVQKLQELDKMKNEIFTNLSHELRTRNDSSKG